MNEQQLTRIFIGPRADYYLKKWQSNRYSFCWPALLFGVFWMLYRKMYLFAFYVFLTAILYMLIAYLIGFSVQYMGLVGFLVSIFLAIFGHQLYRSYVTEKVQNYMKNPQYDLEIFRLYGGVTCSVPIMWLVLQMLLILLLLLPMIQQLYFNDPTAEAIYPIEIRLD